MAASIQPRKKGRQDVHFKRVNYLDPNPDATGQAYKLFMNDQDAIYVIDIKLAQAMGLEA